MVLSTADIITLLTILALLMLIVVLYHLIFVAFNMRKITGRIEGISREIEALILKPLSAIDTVLDWLIEAVSTVGRKNGKKNEKGNGHGK